MPSHNIDGDYEMSGYGFHPLDAMSDYLANDVYQLLCIDEPFNVYGDFNSMRSSNLMVTFEVCDD